MATNLRVVEPDNDLEDVMSIMTNERIRHLPVIDIDKDKIVGLISIRDVIKYHTGNLKSEVHYLKDYILNQ
jgi:CBS domain-containing protein